MTKLALSLFMVLFAVGCSAQVTPNPTVYTPPATTGTAYTPLNQTTPATGTTYTDTNPPAGTYYYIAQSVITSTGQVSAPSNVAGPFTTSGTNSVDLSWTAPTSGSTPTGYVISRAAAIATSVIAPTLGTGSIVAKAPVPEILQNVKLTGTTGNLSRLTLTGKLDGK